MRSVLPPSAHAVLWWTWQSQAAVWQPGCLGGADVLGCGEGVELFLEHRGLGGGEGEGAAGQAFAVVAHGQ